MVTKLVDSWLPTPFTAAMVAIANAGGNQAVFDGGGAGLVLREPSNKLLHQVNSMYTWLIELTLGLSGVLSTRPWP